MISAVLLALAVAPVAARSVPDSVRHTATQHSSIIEHRLLDRASLVLPDTGRPRAVQFSDGYYTRLAIHRVGSYAILPLFFGEYLLGDKLLDDSDPPDWMGGTHQAVAMAILGVFAVNSVTGVWNLLEARHEPEGRARRILHSVLMLAADAGFAYTATLGGDAGDDHDDGVQHRNAALTSIGLATVSTVMMWLWKGGE